VEIAVAEIAKNVLISVQVVQVVIVELESVDSAVFADVVEVTKRSDFCSAVFGFGSVDMALNDELSVGFGLGLKFVLEVEYEIVWKAVQVDLNPSCARYSEMKMLLLLRFLVL